MLCFTLARGPARPRNVIPVHVFTWEEKLVLFSKLTVPFRLVKSGCRAISRLNSFSNWGGKKAIL